VKALGERPARAFCVHGEDGLQPMQALLRGLDIPQVDIPTLGQSVSF
jgi:hypothetical protein